MKNEESIDEIEKLKREMEFLQKTKEERIDNWLKERAKELREMTKGMSDSSGWPYITIAENMEENR
jgi:hypothetical protein